MMGKRRCGKRGKCKPNFLFAFVFFFLVVLRTASHLTMPGTRALAVLKTDLSYAKNTKDVFWT